jgi:hypothetical protein
MKYPYERTYGGIHSHPDLQIKSHILNGFGRRISSHVSGHAVTQSLYRSNRP